MAATSGSASGLAGSASIMPTWSKSHDTEPEVPSWPLRNSTRISGAVRFTLSVRHSTITGTRCGAKPSYITCSKCTASPVRPAPFLMARSSVSLGIEALRACSTTSRRRELEAGSAPLRAAIMISLASLLNSRPLALAARSLCFAFHWAPMSVSLNVCCACGRVWQAPGSLQKEGLDDRIGATTVAFFPCLLHTKTSTPRRSSPATATRPPPGPNASPSTSGWPGNFRRAALGRDRRIGHRRSPSRRRGHCRRRVRSRHAQAAAPPGVLQQQRHPPRRARGHRRLHGAGARFLHAARAVGGAGRHGVSVHSRLQRGRLYQPARTPRA